jgi:hypothetical protein
VLESQEAAGNHRVVHPWVHQGNQGVQIQEVRRPVLLFQNLEADRLETLVVLRSHLVETLPVEVLGRRHQALVLISHQAAPSQPAC